MNYTRSPYLARVLLVLCFTLGALGVALFFPMPPTAQASVITVNSLTDTAHTCATTGTGTCSLRDAINYANINPGADIINITVNGTISLGSQLPAITTTITINGPGANLLTVSGNDSTQIVYINSPGVLNLNNVTVAHGSGFTGGAIQNNSILRISNSVFSNNTANAGGGSGATAGAIYNGGTLNITSTSFLTNTAVATAGNSASAGAIRNNNGTVTIISSTLSYNSATSGAGAISNESHRFFITSTVLSNNSADYAGAIYNFTGGDVNIYNSTFTTNSVTSNGAAIYNGGTMTMTNATLSDNIADLNGGGLYQNGTLASIFSSIFTNNTAQSGGGIYKVGGTLAASNSTFSNNHASSLGSGLGGGAYTGSGATTFSNSTIDHNNASGGFGSGHGGGLYLNNGSLFLLASTVNNNSASGGLGNGTGGGMFISGTLSVINSTIANNTASAVFTTTATIGGAGIYNNAGTSTLYHATIAGNVATYGAGAGISNTATINLYNTIVANNTAALQPNCSGTIGDGGGNLQWNPSTGCGFALTPGDPKLATLANYGGPTMTMALEPGSAAIDVPAADAGCVAISLDQRGVARPKGTHCDVGAFEGIYLWLPLVLR